jgi:hypothetical protein
MDEVHVVVFQKKHLENYLLFWFNLITLFWLLR